MPEMQDNEEPQRPDLAELYSDLKVKYYHVKCNLKKARVENSLIRSRNRDLVIRLNQVEITRTEIVLNCIQRELNKLE